MDVFADKLGRIGAWAGQNKYLGAIKNSVSKFYASYNCWSDECTLDKCIG